MESIFEKIINFVERQRWKYNFQLTRHSRLEEDLGIYGDDATEFIIAFGKEFSVDVSNFMAAEYFRGEGIDFIGPIIQFLKREKTTEKKILTLGHLEKAALAGRLDEDVINSKNN